MDTVNAVVHQNGDPIHNTNTTNFDVGSTSLTTETDSCSASAPVGPNESPTKKISIDDSDSDVDDIPEYDYNNGLGYSDHNYDVPNPARRARCDPEQAKDRFPKLGFISSPSRMDSNSRNGTHSQDAANRIHDNPITKPVIRSTHPIDSPGSTAMSSAYNAEYHQSGQRSNINYNPIRADFAFMDSSYGAASVSSPRNIHGQQQFGANNVKRGGVHRASTAVPTPVSKHVGQRFTTMATTLPGSFESPNGNNDESGPPTLQAAPKVDAPPHRMVTESTTARVMAPDQAPHRMIQQTRIRMPFNTSDPSQVALANAPAPMVKASRGSKPLIRGRSGSQPSRGKKEDQGGSDDGEEAVGSASSQTASAVASSSPASRKQVHFSDDVSATVNEDTVPAGDGHLIALAEGPCSPPKMQSPLKVPPIPPHRMISSTTASFAITPPRLPKRPVMPPRPQRPVEQRADPHSMPDNIIEDSVPVVQQTSSPRKMLKDTSLPPEVAAMAVEFASKTSPVQPNIDENSDEFIKAKIAAISQEIAEEQKQIEQRRIEHEQMQEKHDQGVGRLRVPGESGGPVVESRGRGRPKGSMGRARSSLSGSSALSEGPGDVIPGTSHPWSPSRVQINRKPARPPGSSPVRTNLDFHNRISASDTIAQPAASPARNVNHIPRPVYPIPAPSSGLSTTQLAKRPPQGKGRSVTVAPVPSHSRSDDSDSSEDEHDEQDWGDDYVTRCICGMKHDDGFMVACDQCDVWQHCVCVGLSKDVSEEDYLCEECDPNKHLKYNRSQARDIQKRQLAKLKQRTPSGKGKGAKKSTNATSANSVKSGSRSRSSTTPGKTPISSKKFRESSSNTYSKLSKRMLGLFTPTSNGFTLSRHHRVNKLLVAPGTEGLVSKDPVDEGVAVMELVGHICLPNECTRDAKGASVQQSFVLYDGLADSNSTASMQRESYICIDSRKIGNDSHVVRRCCRPNSVLRHVLENGEIHVYIVTNENLPSTTEITIPFDVDQNPSSDDCSCKDTSDDHCLLLLNADLETGHRDRAAEVEEKKPVDVPKEVKKVERRGRPKKNSSATVPPPKDADLHSSTGSSTRIPKEEKSEEEVVADLKLASSMETSEVDASSSAVSDKRSRRQSGGVKKESEKEDSSKEEVKIERTSRSSPKKEVKEEEEHMNYALPADRSKQTREERKLTAQLALIEKIAQKKEKKPKEASTPSSRAKTVAPPTKTPSSRSKTSLPAPAASSKKTSREAEDTKEGTRSKKKKEVVAEPEPELSSSSPSTVQPPRKRWAAAIQQEEKHASAAVSAAPSDPPSLGGKKQWLKRHAAQSISENDSKDDATLSPDTPHTSASPPSKKGRNQRDSSGQSDDQKREEAANVLAGMGSVREGTESPELFAKLQSAALKLDVTNSMRADFVLPSLSPTGIVLPTAEKTEPKVEATEAPAVQQPEPPAKVSKRISLEDYKRRKSTTAPATTDAQLSPKRERGFIPSMKNLPAGASLLPLHLPGESAGGSGILKSPIESSEKVSIEALKATIYGDQVPSGSLPPPPPPPRVMQSPQDGGNVSTDEEGSTHRLSLAERLRTEFGCGGVASSNAPLAVEPESPAPPPPTSSRRDSRHTSPRGERRRWN